MPNTPKPPRGGQTPLSESDCQWIEGRIKRRRKLGYIDVELPITLVELMLFALRNAPDVGPVSPLMALRIGRLVEALNDDAASVLIELLEAATAVAEAAGRRP